MAKLNLLTKEAADKVANVVQQVVSLSEDALFIPTFRRARPGVAPLVDNHSYFVVCLNINKPFQMQVIHKRISGNLFVKAALSKLLNFYHSVIGC